MVIVSSIASGWLTCAASTCWERAVEYTKATQVWLAQSACTGLCFGQFIYTVHTCFAMSTKTCLFQKLYDKTFS